MRQKIRSNKELRIDHQWLTEHKKIAEKVSSVQMGLLFFVQSNLAPRFESLSRYSQVSRCMSAPWMLKAREEVHYTIPLFTHHGSEKRRTEFSKNVVKMNRP